ncbi:MAG: flagellar biosynthetic protein FliO [FCB group bacterium]|nr:flagellar biosynthetic protein FliO [FCB group bacterium]
MEKKIKQKRRSQLIIAAILIVALLGALIINTDRVSAERNSFSSLQKQGDKTELPQQEKVPNFFSSTMPSLLKLVSALIVVIICIYFGIFLLKKLMGKKYSGNSRRNFLEVLETTYIAPKKSVTLLRVADKAVLIGMSESHIAVLTELDDAQTKEILVTMKAEEEVTPFKNMLKSATQKWKKVSLQKDDKAVLET